MEEAQKDAGILDFSVDKIVLISFKAVKAHISENEHQAAVVGEYILQEMMYQFCPSVVPPHRLIVKNGVPVMMIHNNLFPNVFNESMIIVK